MVVATMERFPGSSTLKRYATSDTKKSVCRLSRHDSPPNTLGILAFEAAKTMSRLFSLYKSLSDDEIFKLRKEVMRSPGVSYLNCKDEGFLLNLACVERLEELDRAASAVSRLGRKCVDFGLNRFDLVYNDLKDGMVDLWKIQYKSKEIDKVIYKMKKFISTTSSLYSALESLSEMEVSERKLQTWNKSVVAQKTNFDLFNQKIAWQRKQVRTLKEVSLWSQTFDKSVSLMARIVCIVYARICDIFRPYIAVLPRMSSKQKIRIHLLDENPLMTKSGPIPKTLQSGVVHFYNRESKLYFADQISFGIGLKQNGYFDFDEIGRKKSVLQGAPPSTLGGSGLALRYANIIILAERYLHAPNIAEVAREDLYHMLPDSLKVSVEAKLKRGWQLREEDEPLAEGWSEAVKEILRWLAPMAHDTLKWQTDRNLEKQKFEGKSTVLLLQTLYYSDREKTEAAIAEVLVGLSCIYQYRTSVGERYR